MFVCTPNHQGGGGKKRREVPALKKKKARGEDMAPLAFPVREGKAVSAGSSSDKVTSKGKN